MATDLEVHELAAEVEALKRAADQRDHVIATVTASVNALVEQIEALVERLNDQEHGAAPDPEIGLP